MHVRCHTACAAQVPRLTHVQAAATACLASFVLHSLLRVCEMVSSPAYAPLGPHSTPTYLPLTCAHLAPPPHSPPCSDIKTLEEDPGAAMEFARSKSEARKEGLTGIEFSDVAGLGPILDEVVEVVEVRPAATHVTGGGVSNGACGQCASQRQQQGGGRRQALPGRSCARTHLPIGPTYFPVQVRTHPAGWARPGQHRARAAGRTAHSAHMCATAPCSRMRRWCWFASPR